MSLPPTARTAHSTRGPTRRVPTAPTIGPSERSTPKPASTRCSARDTSGATVSARCAPAGAAPPKIAAATITPAALTVPGPRRRRGTRATRLLRSGRRCAPARWRSPSLARRGGGRSPRCSGGSRRAGQPAAPGNGERVTPWGRQPPIGEQSIPRNLAHTVHGALDERARRARADGGQFHVYERGMGSDDGEPDARGARVHAGRLDRSDGDGECAALGLTERRELGGCEKSRIELRERIPVNVRPGKQHGGVALPGEGEAGAQILVRLDPLFARDLERPVGRDDLAQQRQRALHFESLVELVGLP